MFGSNSVSHVPVFRKQFGFVVAVLPISERHIAFKHCNTLQHTTSHCNTSSPDFVAAVALVSEQHTATHTIRFTAIHCNTHPIAAAHCNTLQQPAVAQVLKLQCSEQGWSFASCFVTHCNTLQHVATYCNTPQHAATYCNTLQRTITAHHL